MMNIMCFHQNYLQSVRANFQQLQHVKDILGILNDEIIFNVKFSPNKLQHVSYFKGEWKKYLNV